MLVHIRQVIDRFSLMVIPVIETKRESVAEGGAITAGGLRKIRDATVRSLSTLVVRRTNLLPVCLRDQTHQSPDSRRMSRMAEQIVTFFRIITQVE
jgi:hypothetical protein